ncbi:hypothetical protein GYMLUDRAFT_402293 [Collybiopsis luxurians FD-317 M1]|nr:hypothetical protein GYMLUDRAFT_402293 [Collybiopsis luxurians FD-317 M1]
MGTSTISDNKISSSLSPLVTATMLNTFLYGLCCLQFIRYFTAGTRDRLSLKLLISWEFLIDTFHSAAAVYLFWQYTVESYINPASLETALWPLTLTPVLTVISALPIQMFLSQRVKKLSGSQTVFITLVTLSCIEGSLGITIAALSMQKTNLAAIKPYGGVAYSWLVLSVVTDVAIRRVQRVH